MGSIAQILAQTWADVPEQQQRKRVTDMQVAQERLRQSQERLTLERERVLQETERRKEQEAQREAQDDLTIQQAQRQFPGKPDEFRRAVIGKVRPARFSALDKDLRLWEKEDRDANAAKLAAKIDATEVMSLDLDALNAIPEAERQARYQERFSKDIAEGSLPAQYDLKLLQPVIDRAKFRQAMAKIKIDEDTLAQRKLEYEKPKPAQLSAKDAMFLEDYIRRNPAASPTDAITALARLGIVARPGTDIPYSADVAKQKGEIAAAGRAPDKPPSSLLFVPKPEGGYDTVEYKPGMNVPEGAVTASGLSALSVPPAVIRTMKQRAPTVQALATDLNRKVEAAQSQLGPGKGRWNEFMTGKGGLENVQFKAIRDQAGLLSSLLMQMHVGLRGGEYILKKFDEMIGAGYQSPENMKASLQVINRYAELVKTGKMPEDAFGEALTGGQGGTGAGPAGTTGPKIRKYNRETGKFEP